MHLAKQQIDLGMFTCDLDLHRAIWTDRIGIALTTALPIEEGWTQYRFDVHGSVIKVNHWIRPLPELPSTGYTGLTIGSLGSTTWAGVTPEGGHIRTVSPGTDGVDGIAITVTTPDPAKMMAFYTEAMEFEAIAPDAVRCGRSIIFVRAGVGGVDAGDVIGPGYRYLTVQIHDADLECAGLARRGARIVQQPVDYGHVARAGFVCDPDGNWIEISARASLTGVAVGTGTASGPYLR